MSLLNKAGTPAQLPPNQILVGLAMFMTFLIAGIDVAAGGNGIAKCAAYNERTNNSQTDALAAAQVPVRVFMINQIRRSGNDTDVDLFMEFAHQPHANSYRDVGTMTLIPAFMLSELKTAFLLGFRVYLPFVIIDMVISSVLVSMGMMMLPGAVLISLPFKLLLFVLVDGWHLITASLMGSFVM